jgi:ABC-2 type transport system permease protein
MVLDLIFKDILYLRKQLPGAILFVLFIMGIVHYNPRSSISLYILSSVVIAYLDVMNTNLRDDKNNSQVLLNSLPVRRQDIVLAKYLSIFIYLGIGLLLVLLISIITDIVLPSFSMRLINFLDIVGSLVIAIVLFSFYFPFYFQFSTMKMMAFINVCVYFVIFAGGMYLMTWLKTLPITISVSVPVWTLGAATLIPCLMIMLASLAVSLHIYRNKDL